MLTGANARPIALIILSLPQALIFLGMRFTFKKTFSTGWVCPVFTDCSSLSYSTSSQSNFFVLPRAEMA